MTPGDVPSRQNAPSRRMDRDALERIIQRAAELQADELDTGDGLTEQELLKVGAEVGIDGRFLRQALYEENAATQPAERGLLAKWFGPGLVRASRVVQGQKADLEQSLDQWMAESESLAVKRRLPDRTLYERQKGFFAEMKRGLGVGGREYRLAKAKEIAVAVAALESGYCHVELAADITDSRSGFAGGTLALGTVGGVGAAIVASAGAPVVIPVFTLLAFGAGALAVTRGHRPVVERTQLALEQVLDRLERGEIRPKHRIEAAPLAPLGRIADEIRRAITDVADVARSRTPKP